MADSKTKVKTALDESRMLVLGTQVLMGAEFTAVFQSSCDAAGRHIHG